MIRVPPRVIRRLIIDPAVVFGVLVALIALPIWVLVAVVVSRYVPGRWRILRVAGFLFVYLLVQAAALIAMFGLWIASGLGWKIRSEPFQRAHYWLLGVLLRTIVRWAQRAFKLTIDVDDPRAPTAGDPDRPPALVLSRHAGPGDSILLMDVLVNGYRRKPRIVLKEFLQWDPAVDVLLNRVPSAFVPVGRKATEQVVSAIQDLAATMDSDSALVIFPEGANYTERRRTRAIHKLREIGRPDLAERAEGLKVTLPPRTTGVVAALASAPANTAVFFIGHAGLETFVTGADIWREIPMDTMIAAKVWPVPAEAIPPAAGQEEWLYDTWSTIDQWITDHLAQTGEVAALDAEH